MSTLDAIVQRRVLYALAVSCAKWGLATDSKTVARAAGVALTLTAAVLVDAVRSELARRDTLYGGYELTEKGIRWLAPEAFGGRRALASACPSTRRREAAA